MIAPSSHSTSQAEEGGVPSYSSISPLRIYPTPDTDDDDDDVTVPLLRELNGRTFNNRNHSYLQPAGQ